jgi:hypothetical protein
VLTEPRDPRAASSAAPDVYLEIAVTNPRNACADGSIIVAQEKTVGECQGYAGAANLDDLHGRGNKLGGRMSFDEHGNFEDGVPNGIRTRVLALKGPRPGPLDDGDGWEECRILSMIARPTGPVSPA